MNGWQEPKDGKRIYIITDNTKMDGFTDYIKSEDVERLYVTYSESRVNLGIHYYRNKLYTSNLVGICRIKSVDDETLYDAEGNELLIKVIPRFNVKIVELLNYMRDDDEFDRYMAPQTISNRHKERDIEAIDRNEIFYFYVNENPLKVDEKISGENSIITVTVFLTLLRLLCKKPLMGRMMKKEKNLTGKVKGKIVIEKNIRANTMHGRNDRFYCQYLQFSEDIIENQILKAALKKSKRFVIEYFKDCGKDNNNYTSMISYCSNALRNISDIQCDGEACNGLKFSGCYIYYKPVMAMAKMILDDISIESNGDVSTTGYILPYAISMEKLFEVYVRAYFKKNGIAYFISVPGVMDALHDYSAYKPKERYIRIEGDNIFLMGSTRLYGYNKEYYSFALCCMLECLGKYSVRYEDAKGWEDIHHQIEVTEKSTGEVYEIKYRRSDKKFSIYKKDGSATVYANLEDTFNALK